MKWLVRVGLALLIMFTLAQLIRPSLANPPVDATKTLYATERVPADVRAMLDRACADCHSNHTTWPWYSRVAPMSWVLADHVKDGRKELNFDEWGSYSAKRKAHKLKETCEQVERWEMPMKSYIRLHPEANLSQEERAAICRWAQKR